jgi:type VII secretion protein EccB
VQTRRDQLQAYRFQNRRALAALVKGEPNVLEAPMRRLTVTTLSGILIAILIAAVFAALAVFKPSSGSAWKAGDAVIIDRDSGADYVYLDHVLHPVINYPSAVLALGATSSVKRVFVNPSDIAGARRGTTIGITGIPLTLPDSSQLVSSPITVCSQVHSVSGQLQTRVSVFLGGDAGAKPLPAGSSLLVTSAAAPAGGAGKPADAGGTAYLLYNGKRYEIGTAATQATVEAELKLNAVPSITVGRAFLNGVPSGTPLAPPKLAGVGTASGNTIGSTDVRVGQLVLATDADQLYVMLKDGVGPVDALEAKLLQTLPGPDGTTMPIIRTSTTLALKPGTSEVWKGIERLRPDVPQQLPAIPDNAATNQGACAQYPKNSDQPDFTIPPSLLPSSTLSAPGTPAETSTSTDGFADRVVVAPNHAVVGQVMGQGGSDFLISDAGQLYPVASTAVLAGFGYGSVKPTPLPAQIVGLIPATTALSRDAALASVGR